MQIRIATLADADDWAALRAKLWPEVPLDQLREEVAVMLAQSAGECATFLDVAEGGEIRAFAEVSLRHENVNGCDTSPVAFLEGIYVHPEDRGTGTGKRLIAAVQSWARAQGCSELGSDADLENVKSHAFHKAAGFEETQRVVYFRKAL